MSALVQKRRFRAEINFRSLSNLMDSVNQGLLEEGHTGLLLDEDMHATAFAPPSSLSSSSGQKKNPSQWLPKNPSQWLPKPKSLPRKRGQGRASERVRKEKKKGEGRAELERKKGGRASE